jgi:Ca2+-binding EF-hand superfamily protein
MKKILAMVVAAGLCVPVMMTAQEKKSPEDAFKALDKNNDMKLSKEEYVGDRKDDKKTKAEERFATADANKDGFLSLEEYKTIMVGKKKDK